MLRLFGPCAVLREGHVLALPVRKTLALLVYLALEGCTPRARLADLLWPELDEATARRNLRRAVHRLRVAGLDAWLVSAGDNLGLVDLHSDLDAFDRAFDAADASAAGRIAAGRFLDGIDLDDAPRFAEWLSARRERQRARWRSLMSGHADALEAKSEWRAALDLQIALRDDDPLQEAGWRACMRLHARLGERAAALEAFERCRATLRDELGLSPLAQTAQLADAVRRGDALPPPPAAVVAAGAPPLAPPAAPAWHATDLQQLPLIARDPSVAAIVLSAAALVLVLGEAGVGKSRVAGAAAQALQAGPPVVVRFAELSMATPYAALAVALREPAALAALQRLPACWRHELVRLLPELALPGSPASSSASAAQPAAAPASSDGEAQARLLEALAQAFAALGPVIVLDDLHWADASSLACVVHLAQRRAQDPAHLPRLIGTARSAELAEHGLAAAALAALERQGLAQRQPLAAFDEMAMLQLVQRLSNSDGGVHFAARLSRASGGNVFFALEILRALLESGELRVDARSGWSTRFDDATLDYRELPLPTSVVDAIRGRVARLGVEAQRVLETAALADDDSTLAELQPATALSEWEALAGIECAVAAHMVERRGNGFRFAHELFRAAIGSGLSPERRRLIHARLAATLEPAGTAPARVAAHWEGAGNAAAAVRSWLVAAEAAAAIHALRDSAAHYGRAAALETDPKRRFEFFDERVRRMLRAGMSEGRDASLAAMQRLADESGESTLAFRALTRAAEAATHAGDMVLAESLALRALERFEPPEPRWRVHALNCVAHAARRLDQPALARDRYLAALELSIAAVPAARGMLAASLSSVCVDLGCLPQALEFRDRALAWTDGDGLPLAQVLSKTAWVLRACGRRLEGIDQFRRGAAITEALGVDGYIVFFQLNLCEALLDDGDKAGARAAETACAAAARRTQDAQELALAAQARCRVAIAEGRLGAAIDAGREAIRLCRQPPDRRETAALLGNLFLRIGAPAQAGDMAAAIAGWPMHVPDRLPLASIALAAALDRDTGSARAALHEALLDPHADRVLHEDIDSAHVLLGQLALAAGDAAGARAAVARVGYSVAHEGDALAVRLAAGRVDGRADEAAFAAATALVDSGRLPALVQLDLLRALADETARLGRHRRWTPGWRERMAAQAQSLADALQAAPPLQAGFIRRHRDLLT